MTAEELDKEFTTKGAKEEDLKKYANKNIAVTGRVSLLSLEKKGTTQPWVTLFAARRFARRKLLFRRRQSRSIKAVENGQNGDGSGISR